MQPYQMINVAALHQKNEGLNLASKFNNIESLSYSASSEVNNLNYNLSI